jgi:hypothetical protein
MIVKGDFVALSIAVYGELVNDSAAPLPEVVSTQQPLPSIDPAPLQQAIDPANSNDPTFCARQLLTLIPNDPHLPLAIRHVFCLKPLDSDWTLPEFPHLYADISSIDEGSDLEDIVQVLSRPVEEDLTEDSVKLLVERISQCPRVRFHRIVRPIKAQSIIAGYRGLCIANGKPTCHFVIPATQIDPGSTGKCLTLQISHTNHY